MKILYIAVHRHKDWGAEFWLAKAFERQACEVVRFDYRAKRKKLMPWWLIQKQLLSVVKNEKPDVIFLQRAEKMPAQVVTGLGKPVFFWSTEPLIRRRDVDKLLAAAGQLEKVLLHTYTCLSVIQKEFPEIHDKCMVFHNAGASEVASVQQDKPRARLAVFNRNVSPRRKAWLDEVGDLVEIVEGQFGDSYFETLKDSKISLNIHFADASVDDFETGIFEALACGAVVITETLNPRTVDDMGMASALIEVSDAKEMRLAVEQLIHDPNRLSQLQCNGYSALEQNTWDSRAKQLLQLFDSSLDH